MAGVVPTNTALCCSAHGWHSAAALCRTTVLRSVKKRPCSFFWHEINHPVQPSLFSLAQKTGPSLVNTSASEYTPSI